MFKTRRSFYFNDNVNYTPSKFDKGTQTDEESKPQMPTILKGNFYWFDWDRSATELRESAGEKWVDSEGYGMGVLHLSNLILLTNFL